MPKYSVEVNGKNSSLKRDTSQMTLPFEQNLNPTKRRNATMTEPNNHPFTDDKNEELINSLRNEISDLKSRLTKKDERIATLDLMLKTVMEGHHAQIRAYEDLEDKLDAVIEKLRNRVPHSIILDFLKVKHSDRLW
jgi:NTP pyrophosphatase (non-canonical NTP hydrolase)